MDMLQHLEDVVVTGRSQGILRSVVVTEQLLARRLRLWAIAQMVARSYPSLAKCSSAASLIRARAVRSSNATDRSSIGIPTGAAGFSRNEVILPAGLVG